MTSQVADSTFGRRWWLLAAALYPLVALWSLANPMFASPDENLHMVRAQSIAQGDFSSPFTTDGMPVTSGYCYIFQAEVTAACQDLTWGEPGAEYAYDAENYPALFHAIAAVPAVVTSGLTGAYVMRLWLGALCVAVLAWAGAMLTRPGSGRWPIAGFLVAVTPMAVFLMSTVNPSGLAIACSALFVAGILSAHAGRSRARSVVAAIALGASGLVLVRRDGIVWLAIVSAVLVPLLLTRLRGRSARLSRSVLLAVVAAVVILGFAIVRWAGPTAAQFLDQRSAGGGTDPWEAARYVRAYVFQLVGTFGWLDSPIGEETFLLAMLVSGLVVLIGLCGRGASLVASTSLGIAALILSPVGFGMVWFPYFQGRYLLPVWVCLLLVASVSAVETGIDRRTTVRALGLVLGAWVVVHLVGFVQNLRRYAVGRSGSWRFVIDADWNPPMMSNLLAVTLFVAALLNAVVLVVVLCRLSWCGDGTVWAQTPGGDSSSDRFVDSDLFGEPARHAVEDRPADGQAGE